MLSDGCEDKIDEQAVLRCSKFGRRASTTTTACLAHHTPRPPPTADTRHAQHGIQTTQLGQRGRLGSRSSRSSKSCPFTHPVPSLAPRRLPSTGTARQAVALTSIASSRVCATMKRHSNNSGVSEVSSDPSWLSMAGVSSCASLIAARLAAQHSLMLSTRHADRAASSHRDATAATESAR